MYIKKKEKTKIKLLTLIVPGSRTELRKPPSRVEIMNYL